MFPSIDNKSGLKSVHHILELRDSKFLPTICVIETVELCLFCINSIFNNTNSLQTDSKAQVPHMSCSYADVALASYDSKALAFDLSHTTWKSFPDDVFVVWKHGPDSVSLFLEYLNNIDKAGKIQFTTQAAGDDGLEFLDLRLKMVNGKISIDDFSKPTNNFTYLLPSTCYPNRNIKNVPKSIAVRLRRNFDINESYEERSEEYQKHLIVRDCQPWFVKRQFQENKKLSRSEA